MADMKLKECPWCTAGTTLIHENKGVWGGTKGYSEPISVEVQHWCEKEEGQPSPRRLVFVGRDTESAIRIWNTRITDPTIEAQEAEIKRLREALADISKDDCRHVGFCQCAANRKFKAQAALKKGE